MHPKIMRGTDYAREGCFSSVRAKCWPPVGPNCGGRIMCCWFPPGPVLVLHCCCCSGVVRTGADCACLILTGNVPFSLPINRTLAISLPKVCKSLSVPLQCRDTATQIPAPGPVAFAPALPPLPPLPPESSVDATATSPAVEAPPAIMQGQRPVVVLSSAWRNARGLLAPAPLVLLVLASILV